MAEPRRSALERALELAAEVARGGDPTAILERILDSAIELTAAERAYVVEPDAQGGLVIRAARNAGQRPVESGGISETLVRKALETRTPVVAANALEDPRFRSGKSVRRLSLRSLLAVPLVTRGEVLGVVLVEDRARPDAFADAERRLLELVAAQAAVALFAIRSREVLAAREAELALAHARLEERLAVVQGERAGAARRPGARGRRRFERLLGTSPALVRLLEQLERVAASDHPVLVTGESGSGKELVARSLHEASRRAEGPFVAVNAGALPETLLEAELFGHAPGAFTGATEGRAGLIRDAEGGTLFLDEIGDISPLVQVKLLRFLQERTVRPLGLPETGPLDVRIVAATHRDLEDLVRRGSFRQDLYFRLNVLRLEIPPLRARREDLPLLVRHVLGQCAASSGEPVRRIAPAAMKALEAHSWPGNVRELENVLRRAHVFGGDPIEARDLDLSGGVTGGGAGALETLEREAVARALEAAGGNVSVAAATLGIHRATLYRKAERWGLRVRKPRAGER